MENHPTWKKKNYTKPYSSIFEITVRFLLNGHAQHDLIATEIKIYYSLRESVHL